MPKQNCDVSLAANGDSYFRKDSSRNRRNEKAESRDSF